MSQDFITALLYFYTHIDNLHKVNKGGGMSILLAFVTKNRRHTPRVSLLAVGEKRKEKVQLLSLVQKNLYGFKIFSINIEKTATCCRITLCSCCSDLILILIHVHQTPWMWGTTQVCRLPLGSWRWSSPVDWWRWSWLSPSRCSSPSTQQPYSILQRLPLSPSVSF